MQSNNSNIVVQGEMKLSPKELLFKYLVYLPLFILCLAISITFAYLYIRYTVPLYNSSISILIKNERNRTTSNDISLENLMANRSTSLGNEIVVLKSASTMKRVVESLGLDLQYFSEGKVKRSEVYLYSPVIASVMHLKDTNSQVNITITQKNGVVLATWEGKHKTIRTGSILNTSKGDLKLTVDPASMVKDYKYFIHWRSPWSIASELAGGMDVKQSSKDASVLQINITTEVPDKGKDVLNQLIKEYERVNIEDKNRMVFNSLQFIDERLGLLTGELDKAEDEMQITWSTSSHKAPPAFPK